MYSVGKVVNNYVITFETDGKQTYHDDNFELYENESCSVVSNSLRPHGLYSSWNSLGQNTGVGSLSLLQGIFPTQPQNPGLLHCRWILYQLSHKGSLELFNYCVVYEELSITDSMDINLSKRWEIVEDRDTWYAAIHRVTKSQIWLSD